MNQKIRALPERINSREGLDARINETATKKLEFAALKIELELEQANLAKRYQARLTDLTEDIEIGEASVETYCRRHPELFAEKKSVETELAKVGYRIFPMSVQLTKPKDTLKRLAMRLLALEWGPTYVRYSDPVPDRDQLIADAKLLTKKQLEEAGIALVSEEHWYFTAKSAVAEAAEKREAA